MNLIELDFLDRLPDEAQRNIVKQNIKTLHEFGVKFQCGRPDYLGYLYDLGDNWLAIKIDSFATGIVYSASFKGVLISSSKNFEEMIAEVMK